MLDAGSQDMSAGQRRSWAWILEDRFAFLLGITSTAADIPAAFAASASAPAPAAVADTATAAHANKES